ncbi:MAG: tRNA lysidine(34) synthetase TilS [Gammaproteobacteria bacterium]|nr:tRNA lysidine(34) synthetase TilS [Gammaproteobacteria bacterium]
MKGCEAAVVRVGLALEALSSEGLIKPAPNRIRVAYSGGMDSHVLLHALAHSCWRDQLSAVHINHGLQPESAEWSRHCEEVCRMLGVAFVSHSVRVKPEPGQSLESCAREARYGALAGTMQPGDLLCFAHHRDDQSETALMRLLRGSGVRGLAGMPARRVFGVGQLCRPLLRLPRSDLAGYAHHHGLAWLEDPSNRNIRFERNFLRHEILPRLSERRGGVAAAIARSAEHLAEAELLLERMAASALASAPGATVEQIPLALLLSLDRPEQSNLLRYCLVKLGAPLPGSARLKSFLTALADHRHDRATSMEWSGWSIRLYGGTAYLLPDRTECSAAEYAWNGAAERHLPGVGRISLVQQTGGGGGVLDARRLQLPSDHLQIRYRRGGERILLGGMHRPLKKLMQEWRIPPWVRSRTPLLYLDQKLVAVVGHCVSDELRADAGQPGWWPRLVREG